MKICWLRRNVGLSLDNEHLFFGDARSSNRRLFFRRIARESK